METLLVIVLIFLFLLLQLLSFIWIDFKKSLLSISWFVVLQISSFFLIDVVNVDVFLIYEFVNSIFLIGL